MEAFSVVEGQLESLIEDDEREVLAQLAGEVAELLGVEVASRAAELGLNSETQITGQVTTAAQVWNELTRGWGSGDGDEPEIGPPADPAVDRLLPPVSSESEVAAEFRELTQADLRIQKADRLTRFWYHMQPENGPLLRLDQSQAEEVLAAITDIRLVMAQRLGINDASDVETLRFESATGELGQPQQGLLHVSDALAWWQESLIAGLQMLTQQR